ncbi:MAG: hypothetical protein K8F91_25720, partial [Candidatus Obscuribacterales bacterium]|nr:hypothetical protein [Candidatus Obscuribacterales bacterium]
YSEKKYKDAQLQFEQALRISDKKISKIPADDLAECYRGLADSYYCLENFLKAEKYYLKAFPYAKASSHHKDAKYVGEICFQLAYLALVRKDFNNASRYLKEASAFERNGAYSKAQIARLKKMHDYVRREQQQTMAPVKRQTK